MVAGTVQDYFRRPYGIEVLWSEAEGGDAGWVAEVKELPGCIAEGRTGEELLENVRGAIEAWVNDPLEAGDPIPAPR